MHPAQYYLSRQPQIPALLALLFAVLASATSTHAEENWPAWRGPNYDGTTAEKGIPTKWSETVDEETKERKIENITWICDLPEYGRNTPVVWGDVIFLTSHQGERLLLLKINKQSGKIEWTREVGQGIASQSAPVGKNGEGRRHQLFHTEHNLASPSCATDGEVVLVHFGNGDLAAYDFDGNQLWKLNMQEKYGNFTIWWGHANSPVLCGDYAIAVAIQDACRDLPGEPSDSYIVAFDRKTGQEKWRTLRVTEAEKEYGDSYCTPIVRKLGDRTEVVVLGGEILDAYDLETGRRTWFFPKFLGNRPVTGPIVIGDVVYATHGKKGPMVALKLKGSGQQSEEEQAIWTNKKSTPDSSWPVVVGNRLFYITDNGIAHCIDTTNGEILWKERLEGSPFRASVMTDGKNVYFTSIKGTTTVVRASDQFEVVAVNQLDDVIHGSPVVSDGKILLRGEKRLYCIGK